MGDQDLKSLKELGAEMYKWVVDLFPIHRSITGLGVRQTLAYLKKINSELEIKSVPSGYKAFDWTVPKEWVIREAWIKDRFGNYIANISDNNLHIVGYSVPVDKIMPLAELQEHLHSVPEKPNVIPYVTSYYEERWGFCLDHITRMKLTQGNYHVFIDSDLKSGLLNYGELIIPGSTNDEILLSTYVCHPSMANNELSGPVVSSALARWVYSLPKRRYTYRFIFIPETIGSLVYLSLNLPYLKKYVRAGYNVTCVGDDRSFSYLPSRAGGTISDRAALCALRCVAGTWTTYSWLERGSDERQYCAPGIDLPIATIMRTKYGAYPEYHTSADNLDFVSPDGLSGGFQVLKTALLTLERNSFPLAKLLGEPQLSTRGLRSSLSKVGSQVEFKGIVDILSLADGRTDTIEISKITGLSVIEVNHLVRTLSDADLLDLSPNPICT